jgi:hypothetical protein
MIVIAEFGQLVKADLAKARLEAEGIRVVLLDAQTISMNPLYSPALGGVKLAVADEDAARARAILELDKEE